MAKIRAFRGLRPLPEHVAGVAALPYDVVNTEEARALAEGKPYSLLRVSRAELELPADTNPYDASVYERARANLRALIEKGILVRDAAPCLYVYREHMGANVQTGVVAAASVDDYVNDVIKKHEFTRKDKEDDRTRHLATCDTNTGPVFLTYRDTATVAAVVARVTASDPVYDFVGPYDVRHQFWVIDDSATVATLVDAFARIPVLYVADGHHRSASAARVGLLRRECNPGYSGEEPFNWFLAVLFPDVDLRIMDYNRLVRDLNGRDVEGFLAAVRAAGFAVAPVEGEAEGRPTAAGQFGMYLAGRWYRLSITPSAEEARDPVRCLDVSLLQERLLAPLLDIRDPRTDKRIDFVGGIRGLGELVRRVDGGAHAVAFALFPTSIGQLMAIADAGQVMPPKSTWFEPKLLSGLVMHEIV